MRRAIALAAIVGCAGVALGARAWHRHEQDDEDDDDDEDRDDARANYWRAHIVIVGQGTITAATGAFSCTPDGGDCGPKLVAFGERKPPLLRATAAPGWRFDRWSSSLRRGAMPDGPFYVNGFGYADTGETETVTAVFVRE